MPKSVALLFIIFRPIVYHEGFLVNIGKAKGTDADSESEVGSLSNTRLIFSLIVRSGG